MWIPLALAALAGIWFCAAHYLDVSWHFERFDRVPEVEEEIRKGRFLRADSPAMLGRLRERLQGMVWGGPDLPRVLPQERPPDERWGCRSVLHGDLAPDRLLVFDAGYGIRSTAPLFRATGPVQGLFVYHHGHSGTFCDESALLRAVLQAGYDVVALDMPLRGRNNRPTVDLPRLGRVTLARHEELKFLKPAAGHPVQYLLSPILAVVNWAEHQPGYGRIVLAGISGGGWATTVYAAMDPRVTRSIEIAGTYPMFLRFDSARDWGDWEQTLPELVEVADYGDLYLLAAWGRRHTQILNRYDSCCFAGLKAVTYAPAVQARLRSLDGVGEFHAVIDETHASHRISRFARELIVREIGAGASDS